MDKPHIYKITNNINNKFYYGVHKGTNSENYMGSGVALRKAQKKYGLENFSKEILLWFNTIDEAFEYEAVIINEEMVNNPQCYNVAVGGKGGGGNCIPSEETRQKMSKSQRNRPPASEETRKKLSEAMKGKKRSEETKRKISEKLKGRVISDEHREKLKNNRGRLGMKHSEESKIKISETMKGRKKPKVKCPHCEKVGDISNMKRWHFDNCKHKISS